MNMQSVFKTAMPYIMIDVIFIGNYAVHAAVHCSLALGLFIVIVELYISIMLL